MKRFTAKLVQRVSRLGFWRKLVDLVWEKPESPAPVTARDALPQTADAGERADAPASKISLFARLKHALRRRRNPDPEPPASPDQTVVAERPARKQRDPDTPEDAPAVPKRSLLAVLKSKLRRAPPVEQLESDPSAGDHSSPSSAPMQRESSRSRDDDSAEAEETAPPSPRQRVLAVLAKKWVWIPGLTLMLLVPLVTMALMLVQSSQEKATLQSQLVATQKKLDQAASEKKTAAKPKPTRQSGAAVATADSAPSPGTDGTQDQLAAGECEISSKESVTLNLKNCIEGFNAMSQ